MPLTISGETPITTGGAIWSNSNTGGFSIGASADVNWVRDAANNSAFRNGVSSQTLYIYGTFTDTSNYERLQILTQGGNTRIFQQQAGTGAARGIDIGTTASNTNIRFIINSSTRWEVSLGGHFISGVDNTYDIGAAGATRPRNIYAGTSFISNAGPTWTSGSGTPEGAVTAPVGSIFSRTDGGAGSSFYVKESGAGNTGWVAK